MGRLLRRLQYLFRQRRLEAELAEELEFHRATKQQQLEEAGLSSAEAAHSARRALGNMTLAREDARGVWLAPWLEGVRQDLAYALRAMRRQPGFSLVAIGTLAAAIGLNTTLFTIYSAFALRPWPAVPDAGRVVTIYNGTGAGNFSRAAFEYFAEHTQSFEGLFVVRRAGDNVLNPGGDETRASWVSGGYFATLHVPMALGRGFALTDDRSDAPVMVAVLSHLYWTTRFGADSAIVGKTITIEDLPVVVVGVAGQKFMGTLPDRVDVWLPMSAAALFRPNERWVRDEVTRAISRHRVSGSLNLAGRLAPEISTGQAQAELAVLALQFEPPSRPEGHGIRLLDTTALSGPKGGDGSAFLPIFGAVLLVLLLACANVGNLLLARAAARQREIAVRLSVGASRPRILRQLMTESLTLACVAGAIGIAIAWVLPGRLVDIAAGKPTALPLAPDTLVLAYTALLCVLACMVFGLAPALHATRASVAGALKSQVLLRSPRFSLRSVLLSTQLAVSVVLLVAAGLLLRGVRHGRGLDHGLAIDGVTVVSFSAPASVFDAGRTRAFTLQLADEIAALGPADAVGITQAVPFGSGNIKGSFRVPGSDMDTNNAVYEVSLGYFDLLGLSIVAGRGFGGDEAGPNAIVVNESLARLLGSPQAAIGRTIVSPPDNGWNQVGVLRIIGVVRDVRETPLEHVQPTIYQLLSGRSIPHVMVREAAAPGIGGRISAAAARLDPRVRARMAPLSENIEARLQASRVTASVAAALGMLALLLATVGMFGVFSFWVQQRTHEIGIRMALGARAPEVVRLVVASSGRAVATGIVVGTAGALVASRLLQRSLYGLSPVDPITYTGVALLLAVSGIGATFVPARRAAHVDPLVTLRAE